MNRIYHVYIVPAAVFISVVMGGGYGTGREVIEFFTRYGLLGGVLGTAAAACVFAVVLACYLRIRPRLPGVRLPDLL